MSGSVLRVSFEGEGDLPGWQVICQALGGRDLGVRFAELQPEVRRVLQLPVIALRACAASVAPPGARSSSRELGARCRL